MAIFTCIITFQLIWSVFSCSEWTAWSFFSNQIKKWHNFTKGNFVLKSRLKVVDFSKDSGCKNILIETGNDLFYY
jgi:hypothetical protein